MRKWGKAPYYFTLTARVSHPSGGIAGEAEIAVDQRCTLFLPVRSTGNHWILALRQEDSGPAK
jgi:hypothetical protein